MNKPIEITYDERGYHVMVDGVDLARAIASGGLSIRWVPNREHPIVTMELTQTQLRAHLPEATLSVIDELTAEPIDRPSP